MRAAGTMSPGGAQLQGILPGLLKPLERVNASARGRLRAVRSLPAFHPRVLRMLQQERMGGHPADEDHAAHISEAAAWLERAQDATGDGGISRGYSVLPDNYHGWKGWQPSYPETTGYIIPTLYSLARRLHEPELNERASRAARWEAAIQLESGAVRGGVMGQAPSPAAFNTGQVIFGWLAAYQFTGDAVFATAARRAGSYLVHALGPEGVWVQGRSRFARGGDELYNARTAWALAEAGARLREPRFTAAAERALETVLARQHGNGWFPDCCLGMPERPLLHTIAYTVRGLLEGGRVLGAPTMMTAAARAAREVARRIRPDGSLPGRFAADWSPAADYSCLTGSAQIAGCWLRLFALTGERSWLEPVGPVLTYLKRTQNRSSSDPGVRGGIQGSAPLSGAYGRYELLNWATKFFIDALIRDDNARSGLPVDDDLSVLA